MLSPDLALAYHSEYFGTVSNQTRRRIVDFFDNDGVQRTVSRLPYIAKNLDMTPDQLMCRVNRVLRHLSGHFGKKHEPPTIILGAVQPEWQRFVGTVAEIACEQEAAKKAVQTSRLLVTNQQLQEQLGYISIFNPELKVSNGFNFYNHQGREKSRVFACPDGILVGRDQIIPFEYKATDFLTPVGTDKQVENIKEVFSNPAAVRFVRHALTQLTDIDGAKLPFSSTGKTAVELIIASGVANKAPNHTDLNRFYQNVTYLGLPIKSLAFVVMKVLSKEIILEKGWETKQFVPINPQTAKMMDFLRTPALSRIQFNRQSVS